VDRSGMKLFNTTSLRSSLTAGPNVAAWDPNTAYLIDTNVIYLGVPYRCIKANVGIPPTGDPNSALNWVQDCVAVGAAWVSTTPYVVGSNVVYAGQHYRCKQNNTGKAPTDPASAYWDPVTLWMNFVTLAGTANGVPINIQPGMMLEIGGNEVVSVQGVAGNSFTANFTKSRNVGDTIVCRGNPGPPALRGAKTTYNPRHDSSVVLHLSVIQ